jgi:hypothetical protein
MYHGRPTIEEYIFFQDCSPLSFVHTATTYSLSIEDPAHLHTTEFHGKDQKV